MVNEISRWLVERPRPVLWVSGGSGVFAEAVKASGKAALVLQLSAFAPDEALALAEIGKPGGRPASAAELIRVSAARDIVWIDGLDAIQQQAGMDAGHVTDCLDSVELVLVTPRRGRFYSAQCLQSDTGEELREIPGFHGAYANRGSSSTPVSSYRFNVLMCGSIACATALMTGTTTLFPNCL
jgi:hypothetical protein